MPSFRTRLPPRRVVELALYGAAILAAVFLRTIFTNPVEMGGDALQKWEFAKKIASGVSSYGLINDHHTARWGVNLPAAGLIDLLGNAWFVYYLIVTIAFGLLLIAAAVFIDRVARQGWPVFVLFLLVLFAEPEYYRATSQLQPFVFVSLFLLLHAAFLWRSVSAPRRGAYFLAALFIFLAYGAKETAVFYVPGSCAFVLLALGWRDGARTLGFIAAYGVALVAVETLVFSVLAGTLTTRLDYANVHFGHLQDALVEKYDFDGFWSLFRGWLDLSLSTVVIMAAALASTVFLLFRARRSGTFGPETIPGLLFLSFAILETFAVKSIDPLLKLEPPAAKYLADLTPWAALAIAFGAAEVARGLSTAGRLTFSAGTAAAAVVFCVASMATPGQAMNIYPSAAAWMWHADETYGLLRHAVENGVLVKTNRPGATREVLAVRLKKIWQLGNLQVLAFPPHSEAALAGLAKARCITVQKALELEPCIPPNRKKPKQRRTRNTGQADG